MSKKTVLLNLFIISVLSAYIFGCDNTSVIEPDGSNNSTTNSKYDVELKVFKNTNRRRINFSNSPNQISKLMADWGHWYDSSGDVEVAIWEASGYGQHVEVHCDVDPEFVLIGGGAWADYRSGYGALLTASYPRDEELSGWVAKSKDHLVANPHHLYCYAIGLRLNGINRDTLRSYMCFRTNTSVVNNHPNTSVSLPSGYQIIGGGARVNWFGCGNLLTESYPYNDITWKVKSKDHLVADLSSITAYAIGITTGNIPGFGGLKVVRRNPSSTYVGGSVGTVSSNVQSGYALACIGGKATWNGCGRMLFKMAPNPNNGQNILVSSKDHDTGDSGTTTLYYVQIKKQ